MRTSLVYPDGSTYFKARGHCQIEEWGQDQLLPIAADGAGVGNGYEAA
jgi:hypothetical protein